MSYADEVFKSNVKEILDNGFCDIDCNVRPHWEDGTPAHTTKAFGVVNRYDLQKEFPVMTLRKTYFKSCVDELLWIWQKKSNNVRDLSKHMQQHRVLAHIPVVGYEHILRALVEDHIQALARNVQRNAVGAGI